MAARHTEFPLLVWTTLLAVAGLTAQALFILRFPRPADPWWRLGAVYTLLLSFLGTPVWEGFPGAATRVLLPLNVACNVLALRRRAPLRLAPGLQPHRLCRTADSARCAGTQ